MHSTARETPSVVRDARRQKEVSTKRRLRGVSPRRVQCNKVEAEKIIVYLKLIFNDYF